MTQPAEIWELVRAELSQFRIDVASQYQALNARLDGLVRSDVHAADLRRIDDRLRDIADDLAMERTARAEAVAVNVAGIEALRLSLESEAENRRKGDERDALAIRAELAAERRDRRTSMRWAVATALTTITIVASIFVAVFQ